MVYWERFSMSDLAALSLRFFQAFSSAFSAYLSAALSKSQVNFFIQPMKTTHRRKNLLHHIEHGDSFNHESTESVVLEEYMNKEEL